TQMHSVRLIDVHLWVATIGLVLYIESMCIAGVMQGLMWRVVATPGLLTYTFVESLKATYPYYFIRFVGGLLFLLGTLLMCYNIFKTIKKEQPLVASIPQPA
ncbi:MAG: cbb3-type cytochrome c oxidase subunit I, partial [Pseudomonadota bacterium]